MSYPLTQLGSSAFNHHSSSSAEQEYDRLRDLARQEAAKRSSCMDRSHQAYTHGDHATATALSTEAHNHTSLMTQYNSQASSYIFRENNSPGRVASDTIDLHGQFVEEAEHILEQRIHAAQNSGQTHLQVIVGKGNHSTGHIQKIKPKVEEVCRELGLRFATEENAGRIYVDLTGGEAVMPPGGYGYSPGYGGGGGGQHHQQQYGHSQGGGQQHHQPQHQQHHQHQQQQNDPNAELKAEVKKALPGILRQIKRSCCIIM